MAGLTSTGFTPLTFDEIKTNIESRLEQYNPGFDFSPESPDGQLINIMGVLMSQAWTELNNVYHSYNPNQATGQGLRNLGMITGLYKGSATRSQAIIQLTGTAETLVPKGSIVTDANGNEFYTNKDAYIPTEATVLAVESGPIPIVAGTITTIKSVVSGWIGVTQTSDGIIGSAPQTETAYRTNRNKTVMRGSQTVQESMSSRITDLGINQVTVVNNDTELTLPDGTPPKSIQVVVGEYTGISDDDIAQAIFDTKGLGVPTHGEGTGATAVVVQDIHGHNHTVNFTKATEIPIFVKLEVTYHTDEIAGLDEAIKDSISTHINSLLTGEDVIWSRLFGEITKYGESEVTLLEIGLSAITTAASNIVIQESEYASNIIANIDLTSTTA